jgi:negative regulator of flagellin synthesis FlgM
MTSIDRISPQDAARLYAQNTDVSRTAGTTAAVQPAGKAHQRQHVQNKDSVTLSDSARSMAAARTAVQNAPDVRLQKVADIKQQLSDGTYQVSSRALARKMLDTSDSQN